MSTSDYIAVGSLIIAISSFVYGYITNTKRYELTSKRWEEILKWYSETIHILVRLKLERENKSHDKALHIELLSSLSAQIEVGRFYFPNIVKNEFGKEKALVNRGYRNLVLDFLVFLYRIYKERDDIELNRHIDKLQNEFTSYVFDVLSPNSFIKQTKKHTHLTFKKELIFEDYIESSPESLDDYIFRFD